MTPVGLGLLAPQSPEALLPSVETEAEVLLGGERPEVGVVVEHRLFQGLAVLAEGPFRPFSCLRCAYHWRLFLLPMKSCQLGHQLLSLQIAESVASGLWSTLLLRRGGSRTRRRSPTPPPLPPLAGGRSGRAVVVSVAGCGLAAGPRPRALLPGRELPLLLGNLPQPLLLLPVLGRPLPRRCRRRPPFRRGRRGR